ncbi:DNA topoisomerase III [Stutzerimonas nitrititolerans]|uniref:DNA topoisomerase III n=1 Tax=Stutzerimonas nitrititolerans TaxID=2482751 RepID=UPI0028ADEDDF|nr:DNA topoisomerase III [Stutzerimonas nitrititolerans]
MRVVLCEKPSQAADVAKVIGATNRGQGCFTGTGLAVTYCIGHLMENAAPEDYGDRYKKWSLEDLPIIPSEWKMKAKPKTQSQLKTVKALLDKAKELVIATDPDREGELIAWEVIEHCGYKGPTLRMHLSALNQAAIKKAWASLRPASETINQYYSALARGRGDWLVGMNMSRLFTLLGAQAGYQGVLSIGRVQTPTLRIVVDRDRTIKNLVAKPYWDLSVTLSHNKATFTAKWLPASAMDEQGRCSSEQAARQAEAAVLNTGVARVSAVATERVVEAAPLPFSLGDLQQACSAKLGLGAQQTLDIAQSLYETHKATTYPRADNGYLDESMHSEVPQIFAAMVRTDPSVAPLVGRLDPQVKSRAWNSAKVTAHHGIIPTIEPANIERMSEREASVYRLIRAHFLAQFLPAHEYDKTIVQLTIADQEFKASGRLQQVVGWKAVMTDQSAKANEEEAGQDEAGQSSAQVLPDLVEGDRPKVIAAAGEKMMTTPPKHMTEGDLIKAMKGAAKLVSDPRLKQKLRDTVGIGTEATRAGIIETLLERGFIVKKGRTLRATDAAFTLIDSAPEALTNPGMTAVWEQALTMVEEGTMGLDDFVSRQSTWITQMVTKYSSTKMSFKLAPSPPCPVCQGQMRRRPGKTGPFWSCMKYPDCNGTISIEQKGKKSVSKRKPNRKAAAAS